MFGFYLQSNSVRFVPKKRKENLECYGMKLILEYQKPRGLWPLHTRDWEPTTMTLQALSLVEKAEPVPSSLHTTLEGPMGVCECKMMDVKSTWFEWIMFHGYLDYFQKPSLGGRPNTKPGDHGTLNAHNCWFSSNLSCVRARMNKHSLK